MPDPDEILSEYERPEMPWERDESAALGRSGTAMGTEFLVTLGLFLGLGWFLDTRLGTKPWLLVAGAALGLTVGIYRLAAGGARALEREARRPDKQR